MQVTFSISVTISEYFGAWNNLNDKREIKLVSLWFMASLTLTVACSLELFGNMCMGLYGVNAICRTLRVPHRYKCILGAVC